MKRKMPKVKTWWVRKVAYRMGFRPRAGTIWYSPSLAFIYSFRDHWRSG